MRHLRWWGAGLAAFLVAACATPPAPDTPTYHVQSGGMPGGESGGMSGGGPVKPGGVTAFSDSSSYNYPPSRAIDGNPNTEWASRDGETTAMLSIIMPKKTKFTAVRIKAQPTQGSKYAFEASDDGENWRFISGTLTASDWKTETHRVQGEGHFLRVRWMKLNSDLKHWSIFEIQPIGTEE